MCIDSRHDAFYSLGRSYSRHRTLKKSRRQKVISFFCWPFSIIYHRLVIVTACELHKFPLSTKTNDTQDKYNYVVYLAFFNLRCCPPGEPKEQEAKHRVHGRDWWRSSKLFWFYFCALSIPGIAYFRYSMKVLTEHKKQLFYCNDLIAFSNQIIRVVG